MSPRFGRLHCEFVSCSNLLSPVSRGYLMATLKNSMSLNSYDCNMVLKLIGA